MQITMGTIALVAVLAGGVAVQILLSKNKRRGLGLILPVLSFAVAVFFALGLTYWNPVSSFDKWLPESSVWLLLLNLPTAVFLITYFVCRNRLKKKSEIVKMSVQDLK